MQIHVDRLAAAVLHGILQQVVQHALERQLVGVVDAGRVISAQPDVGVFQFEIVCHGLEQVPEIKA